MKASSPVESVTLPSIRPVLTRAEYPPPNETAPSTVAELVKLGTLREQIDRAVDRSCVDERDEAVGVAVDRVGARRGGFDGAVVGDGVAVAAGVADAPGLPGNDAMIDQAGVVGCSVGGVRDGDVLDSIFPALTMRPRRDVDRIIVGALDIGG